MALSVRAFSRAWRILVRRVDETVTDLGYERAKQTYCASGEPKIVEIRRDGDEIEPKPRRGRFRASRASLGALGAELRLAVSFFRQRKTGVQLQYIIPARGQAMVHRG